MPDMLVRLYDLPDGTRYAEEAGRRGLRVRRAEPWDRLRMREFIRQNFQELWAVEADRAFAQTPVISAFLGVLDNEIAGFAAYDATRPNFFGPTGVREDLRGSGLGAALLFSCLHSMREMGYAYAIIGGVGPASFYEKVCGAFVIPGSETGIYGSLAEILGGER
jgi:hypothetical protein